MRSVIVFALVGCTAETGGLAPGPDESLADSSVVTDSAIVTMDTFVEETDSTVVDTAMDVPIDTMIAPIDTAMDTADTGMDAAEACPINSTVCGARCIDTLADPHHCGKCMPGSSCRVGSMCANGVCACQPGLSDCTGICIDTKGHPDACGGCGTKCDSNKRCRDGKCVDTGDTSCPPSRPDECPSTGGRLGCFNTKKDPMHCGGCGTDKRCESDEVCVDGSCKDYVVGIGCTTCECAACLSGTKCCVAPPGSALGRVFCVDGADCPQWLP